MNCEKKKMKSKNKKENTAKVAKLTRDYFESIAIIVLVLIIMLVYATADLDTTPPSIINLTHSEITESSVIINWETDEPSNSYIEYGTTPGIYEYNYETSEYIDVHSFFIQELLPETTYYYRVSSTDINGNSNTSEEQQFTTLEDITSPHYTTITQTPESNQTYNETQLYRFEVDWKDKSQIQEVTITHNFYGAQITESVNLSEQNYVYEITGLKPGTYYWYMNASDISENSASTPETYYELRKAEPIISLTINGQSNPINAYVNETINITASSIIPLNGLVEVLVDGVVLPPSGSVISFLRTFQIPGTHEVKVRFNETENFTSTTKTIYVNVTSPQIILNSSKKNYVISELSAFTFSFPQDSIIVWEICGPIPVGGGFVECSIPQTLSGITSPYAITHTYTNKTGNYSIKVQASYNGMLLEAINYYFVTNSITPNLEGEREAGVGEEISLKSTATGGIGPYNYQWKLSNGSIINGQELKIKYNTKGTYPTNLTITDAKGNIYSTIININIYQKYLLKIIVEDSETKEKIKNAKVRVKLEEKITDSSGTLEFELREGEYSVRIDASGYSRYTTNIELDGAKTFTYSLLKETSLMTEGFNIELTNPYEGYTHGGTEVRLEATIRADKKADCSLYVADGTDWSKQIKTFSAQGTYKFEHLIKVEERKKYTWNIECLYDGKSFSSAKRTFTTRGYSELQATTTSTSDLTNSIEVVDAGELRRKLSDAIDNIAVLDLREKQVAEALQLNERLEKALRDYDRVIRDINNIQYRNDLSEKDKDKKREEYRNSLKSIEEETPVNLKVIDLEEFVSYPKKDELKVIALYYAESTQHTGNLNVEALSELQNSVLVKTKVATVTLDLISGRSKDITLVHKEVTYPKGTQDKMFLLESIPKEFSDRADRIEFLQDYTVINNDPLIKFQNPEKITYYVEGFKTIDSAKQTTTIMFSEGVFAKGGNKFTGNVVLSNIEVTSPSFIIGLLVVIIIVYIIYAYDLHSKLLALVSEKSRKKNFDKMMALIFDAKELLKNNEVESANLVFREIRLIYERLKFEFKKESCSEALSLYDQINLKYFEKILAELQAKEANGPINYNEIKKLTKSYDLLEERQKQMLDNELIITYNSFVERNIRGNNW